MASPSHRATTSVGAGQMMSDQGSLSDMQKRRMTMSSVPPPSALNLPEPVSERRDLRPPSPLRNGVTMDPETGELSDDGSSRQDDNVDDRMWGQRSHSPTPSMAKFASNFAQRVGSLVSNMSSRSGLPTDAELEAEAEMERERSRREAERIMLREREKERETADAEERMMVEERVLALLQNSKGSPQSMTIPPLRSQTMQNPPSPASSQKEGGGWFSAVKNKLTPTKDVLTPAQQIIEDTKAKAKKKGKEREWPASGTTKFSDPAFLTLASSATITPPRMPQAAPVQSSPQSPSPLPRAIGQIQTPDFSPSFGRSNSTDSPSRDQPPLYAQFNAQGVLDVHGTLLTIARRFEKLERWSVGHVRALEERMSDVERWLVDKEKEKEREQETASIDKESTSLSSSLPPAQDEKDLGEIREELAELSGRVSELGREMAKFATSSSNLSSGPSRSVASSTMVPVTTTSSAIASRSLPIAPVITQKLATPIASKPQESSSPPLLSKLPSSGSRTRLPYPSGDYTSPPGSVLRQEPMTPTNSPPPSVTQAPRQRPVSIAGLPSSGNMGRAQLISSPSGLPRSGSPVTRAMSPSSLTSLGSRTNLSQPRGSPGRQTSISPTPRKRYTVALGVPLSSLTRPADDDSAYMQSGLATSPLSTPSVTGDETDSSDGDAEFRGHFRDDTIGKSTGQSAASAPAITDTKSMSSASPPSRSSPSNFRVRAQSSYGPPSGMSLLAPTSSSVTPLKPRMRSKSTDRFGLGLGIESTPSTPVMGRFVDPLVIRKQSQDSIVKTPKATTGRSKVPVGELVAFFDGGKR